MTQLLILVLAAAVLQIAEGQSLQCPAGRTRSGWLDLFPIPCRKSADCGVMGPNFLCCNDFCTKGEKAAEKIRTTEATSVIGLSSTITAAPTTPTTTTTTTPTTTTTTTSTTTTTTTTTPEPTTTTTTTTPPSTTSTTTTTTTTTTPKPTTTTTAAPRPFLQILPIQTTPANAPVKISKSQKYICPKSIPAPGLFTLPCDSNAQCRAVGGQEQVCCKRQCVRGEPAPRPTQAEQQHAPLLGVIPRSCPAAPLGELLFDVQSCRTDADCWPRVCCPDGRRSYCRTARARLDLVPVANRIEGPVRMLESYLQCTPPPEVDTFPQACSTSVDCFPNLCCAEGGKKHCRPPQRSLFSLIANAAQRLG